jgi:hypothetical protein
MKISVQGWCSVLRSLKGKKTEVKIKLKPKPKTPCEGCCVLSGLVGSVGQDRTVKIGKTRWKIRRKIPKVSYVRTRQNNSGMR